MTDDRPTPDLSTQPRKVTRPTRPPRVREPDHSECSYWSGMVTGLWLAFILVAAFAGLAFL